MLIYPAIDLYNKKAVRLFKGDYNQMTIYNDNPVEVANDFKANGATHIHLVDLEGAKLGTTPNFDVVRNIKETTSLFCEIGGGIRDMDVIDKYIDCGIDRVILGTAAVTDPAFLEEAVNKYDCCHKYTAKNNYKITTLDTFFYPIFAFFFFKNH